MIVEIDTSINDTNMYRGDRGFWVGGYEAHTKFNEIIFLGECKTHAYVVFTKSGQIQPVTKTEDDLRNILITDPYYKWK